MTQSTDDAEKQRRSPQDYPEDRFDRISRSSRIGAHRVTARPRYFWQYLIAGLLGFALLTSIGVLAVQNIGSDAIAKAPSATEEKAEVTQVPAEIDPTATVAVLDGTQIPNLGTSVDGVITAEGWGQILFSEKIADTSVEISAVFYRDAADEIAARGLAEKLGGVSTYQTEEYAEFGARLIVLLGADYAGPGLQTAPAVEDVVPELAPEPEPEAVEPPLEESVEPVG